MVKSDCSNDTVVLHSTASVYKPSRSRQSFLEKIQSLPNQTLWRTLQLDGDGSWIYRGLLNNSLVMGSDGSYNESLANDVCSSASLICCNQSGNSASVSWVERSNSHTAGNYRAELLGAVALADYDKQGDRWKICQHGHAPAIWLRQQDSRVSR